MFTVEDLLGLVMDGGLPKGYRIFDYAISENVYDSNIEQENRDNYLCYEVINFNISDFGELEININTEEE